MKMNNEAEFFKRATLLSGPAHHNKLFLSGGQLALPGSPQTGGDAVNRAMSFWKAAEIRTILNVSSGETATKRHLELFRAAGIRYEQIPIDDIDTDTGTDFQYFFSAVLQVYKRHVERPAAGNFLVHCSAGINRSALAAGAILWTNSDEKWKSGPEMIEYMRVQQKKYRGMPILLENKLFQRELVAFCSKENQGF